MLRIDWWPEENTSEGVWHLVEGEEPRGVVEGPGLESCVGGSYCD